LKLGVSFIICEWGSKRQVSNLDGLLPKWWTY